ncbi:glycoside hydrolase [Wilcoxina mikolae CBS 423.85]|nr:glycoside hydrolase [Wilcoxina mikolae CBS 423.85]
MKYSLIALAATAICGASAAAHNHRRHNHAEIFKRNPCSCTTYVTSYVVPVTVYPTGTTTVSLVPIYETPSPEKEAKSTVVYTNTETSTTLEYVTATSTSYGPVPTPEVTTCSTPGVYTIPESTITVTDTQTAIVTETATLTPGCNTYGGITTVVDVPTTVTYPYVAVETNYNTTTSTISETVYVCPTPGTYTLGAYTSTPSAEVTAVYGVPEVYTPGEYHHPEITTTITKYLEVITCPYKAVAPTPVPTYPAETPAPMPTYPAETPKQETPKEQTPYQPSQPEEQKPAQEYPASPPSYPSQPVSGKQWSISYSPYSDNGQCKGMDEVYSDIADIASKGFENVRIYSTDCSGLENVGGACAKHGMGMIVGIFIKAGGVNTGDEQLANLKKWNKFDMVRAVVVGNEAVFNGYCSASDLAGYIAHVKSELQSGCGYTGPVTTTETLNILQANKGVLCPAMDFVGVNIQPYFDGGVDAAHAGEFLASQLKLAEDCCGGKTGYVLEAGWPSGGSPNGKAVASPANQAEAIKEYETAAPGRISYFTYRNDLWKEPGNLGIEDKFGCGQVFSS